MKPISSSTGENLVVELLGEGDRLLAREAVLAGDLQLARDETWREGLRAGALEPRPPDEFTLDVTPGQRHPDGLAGFLLRLRDGEQQFQRSFPTASLGAVARRRLAQLLAADQQLEVNGSVRFRLNSVPGSSPPALPPPASEPSAGAAAPAARVRRTTEPVIGERAPLAEYRARSRLLSRATAPLEPDGDPPPLPAFVPEDVWSEAFRLARRGGRRESAAVLTGRLLQDTESPELFLLVDACIEAQYAEEREVSVTFSGDTWARIREVLSLRRRHLSRPHERLIGVVHGHNFLPGTDEQGQRLCPRCPKLAQCSRTTALASQADVDWFAAVFPGQPWALSLIHGFTARGEDDWRLYHLADGTLAPRTIRCLPA